MDKIKFISIKADGQNDVLHSPFIGTSGYYVSSSDQWRDRSLNVKSEVLEQAKTNRLTNITGKTFYRCGKLALPRDKMNIINQKYNTKVIRDITKADHIIISEKYIETLIDNMWDRIYTGATMLTFFQKNKSAFRDLIEYEKLISEIKANIENYSGEIYYTMDIPHGYYQDNTPKLDTVRDEFHDLKGSRGYHAYITKSNKYSWDYLKNNQAGLIMDSALSALATEDSLIIKRDEFNQLCSMFMGEDKENHTLGMEMLANCNVEESRGFVALLFFRFCENKFKGTKSWNHVNFKTVRNRFEKFSLTWSRHHTSPYDQFITQLVKDEKGLTTFVMESILDTVYEQVIEEAFGIKSNSVFEFKRTDLKLKKEYADKCIDKNIGEVLMQETIKAHIIDDLPF